MNNNIIGIYGLCNVASVAIYNLNDETITAGLVVVDNEPQKPRNYKLYYNLKGVYFNFRGIRIYLHEVMRTN